MTHRARTIVFGLDSYDMEMAIALSRTGRLPWLRAHLQQAAHVSTRCAVLQGAEWINAGCGVDASHHGFSHTIQLQPGTYEEVDVDAGAIRHEPFYGPLAAAGIKTLVVDLPGDRPRPAANLVQVVDWGTEFKLWGFETSPRSLRAEIERRVGVHPLRGYGFTIPDEATLRELYDQLMRGVVLKGRLVRELMHTHADWSVLFAGFCEIHKAGHFFWQYQDPKHPGYRGADHPLACALENLYEALDAELRAICAEAGDPVNVIVMTDRGMQPNYRGDHLVTSLLQKLGLYTPARGATDPRATATHDAAEPSEAGTSFAHRVKQHIPVGLRPLVRRLAGKERVDWARTQVFPVVDVGTSYLRVNVLGREPRGIVRRGKAYDELLRRLATELRALINPATGRSPIEELVFPSTTLCGPLADGLADVGIVWSPEAPIEALESPSIGTIRGARREQRSGNHTSVGAIVAAGPGFKPGGARPGSLLELAPTVLALHGVPRPAWYQSGAMPELIASAH